MPGTAVQSGTACAKLKTGSGLLNGRNQPVAAGIASCFADERYLKLLARVPPIERLADGAPAASVPVGQRPFDRQKGRYRIYFSPEDDVQSVLARELERTLTNPSESFAYVSTNFITNFRLAHALVRMREAGVRMKIFFDRGRLDDPSFQQQVKVLQPLGFTKGETGISPNIITVFNNELTGPYGSNHNKTAVVGVGGRLRLLNGSANWSMGAMAKNDENFAVIEDPLLAAIYLREILSLLHVYRYYQQDQSEGFQEDVQHLTARVPCLKALLGMEASCTTPGVAAWQPPRTSAAMLSVGDAPVDSAVEGIWAWIGGLDGKPSGGFIPLFTHRVFAGRWLAAIPGPLGSTVQFKFIRWPAVSPPPTEPTEVSADRWEFSGFDNRQVALAPRAVHVIRDRYTWGRR